MESFGNRDDGDVSTPVNVNDDTNEWVPWMSIISSITKLCAIS